MSSSRARASRPDLPRASAEDAARTAWTADVRLFTGYDAADPRPPAPRALELARAAARRIGRVGLELCLGTQASDRMVGEPTTYTKAWFDAFPDAADATPLLNEARAIKTEQESSACGSRTRSPPLRWSTSRAAAAGDEESEVGGALARLRAR